MTGAGEVGVRDSGEALRRFRVAYGRHRAREGRGEGGPKRLLALPHVDEGPFAAEWAVRARTYERFVRDVLEPMARAGGGHPLRVLDLGAGNGWLSYRMQNRGHRAVALDLRVDPVDGLGAADAFRDQLPRLFGRIAGSFVSLPLAGEVADLVVFNASLHYATDLEGTLAEAARVVRAGGRIAVLDSPFYRTAEAGEAMVAEKRRTAGEVFGDLADDLMALPTVEYLTRERLERASEGLGLEWRRRRVRYPLWYELRPVKALLAGRRPPSRFDLWWARTA